MATQTVIENPVINSPFDEPKRHFKFSDEGITNEIIEGRHVSFYFIPIAASKKKGKKELYFDKEWTKDRIEENKFINQIRDRVLRWRAGGYLPDYIVRVDDVRGKDDLLNLIVEVTSERKKDKAAKVATAHALDSRRQPPRRLWPLGVCGNHRPVG